MKRTISLTVIALIASVTAMFTVPEASVRAANGFTPIDGVRPVNSRDDVDTPKQGVTAGYGDPLRVDVGALDAVPSDAAAVAVNITATGAEEWGFVAAYPCGSDDFSEWPGNSNVNFDAGMTVANSAIVPLDDGHMCLLTYGRSDVIVDVSGYFASGFTPIDGVRPVNSRDDVDTPKQGVTAGYGDPLRVDVGALDAVPSDAAAVAVNITATGAEEWGFVAAYPCGSDDFSEWPGNSNVNFDAGMTVANSAIVPLDDGHMCLLTYGRSDVIVDVSGYFASGFTPIDGVRPVNSRDDVDTPKQGVTAGYGDPLRVDVGALDAVPSDAAAVAVNITATGAEEWGFVAAYPCGSDDFSEWPGNSNVNFDAGMTVANSAIVPLDDGHMCLLTYGRSDVIVDVIGFMSEAERETSSPTGPNALTFDLNDAAGLALTSEPVTRVNYRRDASGRVFAAEASSNLLAVESDGSVRAASATGSAEVNAFLIGPDGKTYLVFDERTNLDDTTVECQDYRDGGPTTGGAGFGTEVEALDPGWYAQTSDGYVECVPCLLAVIDGTTGVTSCVDSTLDNILWETQRLGHPAVQFDDDGGVYYHGNDRDGAVVLRRSLNGVITDLIVDDVELMNFYVAGDGTVYITGYTESTNAQWFRRVSPSGQLRQIKTGVAEWIEEFPDGNVYFSVGELERWLVDDQAVDDQLWLFAEAGDVLLEASGDDGNGTIDTWEYFDYSELPERAALAVEGCYVEGPIRTRSVYDPDLATYVQLEVGDPERQLTDDSFCNSPSQLNQRLHRTLDGRMVGVAGGSSVATYYPTPALFESAITSVSAFFPIINDVVLAGTNADLRNIVTFLDTGSGEEIELIGPDDEVEVFRMEYTASRNRLMFDGLRFADNKYVIGYVDMATGDVSMTPTGTSQLVDFSTFG